MRICSAWMRIDHAHYSDAGNRHGTQKPQRAYTVKICFVFFMALSFLYSFLLNLDHRDRVSREHVFEVSGETQ
jgi:hypothetical protein